MQTNIIGNSLNDWTIELYSTRKGFLDNIASAPGKNALQVSLGGGRGNTIFLGHSIESPNTDSRIVLKVMTRIFDKEPVKVGFVFTNSSERPWLESKMEEVKPGQWQQLEFELNSLNPEKLAKTKRLNLSIETEGDEGFVLIDQIEFRS